MLSKWLHRTKTGRVVYNHKRNPITERDLWRMVTHATYISRPVKEWALPVDAERKPMKNEVRNTMYIIDAWRRLNLYVSTILFDWDPTIWPVMKVWWTTLSDEDKSRLAGLPDLFSEKYLEDIQDTLLNFAKLLMME